MGCIIKYKGQSISEEQFLQYLNKQIAINNLFNENESLANEVYEALGFKQYSDIELKPYATDVWGKVPKQRGDTNFVNKEQYSVKINTENRGIDVRLTIYFDDSNKTAFVSNIENFENDVNHPLKKGLGLKAFLEANRLITKRGYTPIIDNLVSGYGYDMMLKLEKQGYLSKVLSKNISNSQYDNIKYENPPFVFTNKIYETQITPQQNQQAQQQYSQYLESLNKPNTNPILQGNQANIEEIITQLEKEGLLEIDCKGKLKAEKGLATSFTKGGKWKVIKDLKGYPTHKEGGVDLTIGKDGVSIKNGNTQFTAKHGLVIPKAEDGMVVPDGTRVKVNQDGQIKEYDISSPEYKDLYNSGKLMSYDKNSNTYISTPLKEVVITAEAPQWLKDKRQFEKEYSKDRFIDEAMPKFSRSMGISSTNMNPNNVAEYDKIINDKVVENIFKRKPAFDTDYSNDRLKTLQGFTQKELELIKNSSYSIKIEPSIWSKFEQGLLSIGNMGSPVQFKSKGLSQEEAKKEDNPLNILQPLSIPSKMVQSAYKDNYSFKDALKGKQNNANIGEDIITDPLNLVGLGIWGKLKYANKFKNLDEAYQSVKGLSKEEALNKLGNADKVIDPTKVGSKVLNKTDDVGKDLPKLSNTVDNQLPEIPHEIVLDNNTLNLERLNPKNKRKMLSFDDVDLGSDLTLRNNPSRVADQNTILGKNRSIKSVLNKKTHESIDLKTWQDTDGKIYYYMSASMPSSKLKAGKAYLELEKHIPKGESILENSSLSYDSFLNVLKRTKNPKFETFVKGKIPMNDNAKNNLLKIKGDSFLGSNYFNSEELANSANKELIELTNKYSLPNPTVVPVTSSSGKIKAYEIQLPNIGLKKLYTILGLTSAGTYLQSQQNKSEQ